MGTLLYAPLAAKTSIHTHYDTSGGPLEFVPIFLVRHKGIENRSEIIKVVYLIEVIFIFFGFVLVSFDGFIMYRQFHKFDRT